MLHLGSHSEFPAAEPSPPSGEAGIGPLVLLIEPDPILGLDLADALAGAGLHAFGPVPNAASGLTLLPHLAPDYVVLGLPRRDEASASLLEALRQRGIPFVAHGTPEGTAELPADILLREPVLAQDVVEMLTPLLRLRSRS
ncbi:hypothetical protein [Methylorubrum sp. SB2]|uniref:hypothetical protein n=1 Tax=Methylorubrum subtropicum TaxID=3138812 RepID=UPI00313D5F8D